MFSYSFFIEMLSKETRVCDILVGMPNQHEDIASSKRCGCMVRHQLGSRVATHHVQLHRVQAGQLYLRELRGMEASARVTGDQSIGIGSHLEASGPDTIWVQLIQ